MKSKSKDFGKFAFLVTLGVVFNSCNAGLNVSMAAMKGSLLSAACAVGSGIMALILAYVYAKSVTDRMREHESLEAL